MLYLREVFADNLVDELKSKFCYAMIEKLVKYSSGNPLHIREMLRVLIEKEIIQVEDNNKLNLINPYRDFNFSNDILDTINLRIAYIIVIKIFF